jgi:nitrite reductase (cytochrome c-552)
MNKRYTFATLVIAVVLAAVAAFAITALLVNIFQRKQEAKSVFFRVVEVTDRTEDPAEWGKNFPFQYDAYQRTVDQVRTRFGGSEAVPRTPTEADPRSVVAQSKLEEDPRLKTIWAGYAFAEDFREERGHAYMLEDQTYTRRQIVAKQPGTCLQCHASVYVPMMKLGDGDLMAGFDRLNRMPYPEARKLVTHPVTCIDCHAPDTMQLRITRPAFMEGIRALKAREGIRRGRRSGSCIRGPRACAPTTSWPILRKRGSPTGPMPTRGRPASKRSIRSSRCGIKACTRAPASRAPIATCPTSVKAR